MIARRFLKLLITLRIYTKHFKITYDGDVTSANKIWEARHWSIRSAIKTKYSKIFKVLLLHAKVTKLSEFSLFIFYSTRHDCDNLFCLAKILVDTMKEVYVPNDDTRYYKSTHTIFDSNLPKGTIEFHLVGN